MFNSVVMGGGIGTLPYSPKHLLSFVILKDLRCFRTRIFVQRMYDKNRATFRCEILPCINKLLRHDVQGIFHIGGYFNPAIGHEQLLENLRILKKQHF